MKQSASTGEWIIARYAPVTLFSLRSAYATSKGGKTLLVPTPYAVKMALIDACFRAFPAKDAEAAARNVFNLIKAEPVRVRPPKECIVQNTFLRVLQPARDAEDAEGGSAGPFARTIAYREFVFFKGEMEIAIGAGSSPDTIEFLLPHINYFGKRGSQWQFLHCNKHEGKLPTGFSLVADEITQYFKVVDNYRVTEYLDEFGPKLCTAKDGFERISTYHDGDVKLGEHRILQSTLLPYERKSASRHFTHYRRVL